MNEKISTNILYVAIFAILCTVIPVVLLINAAWNEHTQDILQEQCELVAQTFDFSSPDVFSHLDGYICAPNGTHIHEFSNTHSYGDITAECTMSGGRTVHLYASSGFSRLYPRLIAVVFIVGIISIVLAMWRSKRIVKPITSFTNALESDVTSISHIELYPELEPMTAKITAQRRDSEKQRHEFTANVTHELKTPLTSISGYAEMIATGMAKPNDVQRFAEKIQSESKRMLGLVNDIIELSRLDDCEKIENPVPVDLYNVALECTDQLSAAAEKRNVTLTVSGEHTLVSGDEGKLWELIYNLVDNAINYNRHGGSVIITTTGKTLTVKDTGIGISEENQKRIFERFYRVDKSHSRMTGGTGLGLSIVKHIAEQHNARITLKSEINIGTEITVNFT